MAAVTAPKFAIPGGRASSTDFATAAFSVLQVPHALDQGGPVSSEDSSEETASSDSVRPLPSFPHCVTTGPLVHRCYPNVSDDGFEEV